MLQTRPRWRAGPERDCGIDIGKWKVTKPVETAAGARRRVRGVITPLLRTTAQRTHTSTSTEVTREHDIDACLVTLKSI